MQEISISLLVLVYNICCYENSWKIYYDRPVIGLGRL